jgi:DNA-binding Lrp family transcriptional regulator
MIGYVDETAAKIMLAISPGDSIRRVAKKIGGSYSWVYEWIERLESAVFIRRDTGVYIDDYEIRQQYHDTVTAIARKRSPSIEEGYIIPHFAGREFAFTQIDAVYVWTHGGYQLTRGHDDYPIFMNVYDHEIEQWVAFFDAFDIPVTISERAEPDAYDAAVYYVLFPTTDSLSREWVDGDPIIPLNNTIDHMLEYQVNYEPALELIADEYDRDIDATHDES